MKIVIFEVENWERASFQSLGDEHELHLLADSLSPKNVNSFADADIISTFVYIEHAKGIFHHADCKALIYRAKSLV